MNSLLTGQLVIELEFHPNAPMKMVGLDKQYAEIPTIPSTFDVLFDKLKDLDLAGLVAKLTSAIDALEKVLVSPEIPQIMKGLRTAIEDAKKVVEKLDSRVDPMFNGIDETVKEYGDLARNVDEKVGPLASNMDGTVKDARKLVLKVDRSIEKLAAGLDGSLKEATRALKKAEEALGAVKGTVGKDSPVVYQLDDTLKEISAMARAFKSLAGFLERHPEALLRGKGSPERR